MTYGILWTSLYDSWLASCDTTIIEIQRPQPADLCKLNIVYSLL